MSENNSQSEQHSFVSLWNEREGKKGKIPSTRFVFFYFWSGNENYLFRSTMATTSLPLTLTATGGGGSAAPIRVTPIDTIMAHVNQTNKSSTTKKKKKEDSDDDVTRWSSRSHHHHHSHPSSSSSSSRYYHHRTLQTEQFPHTKRKGPKRKSALVIFMHFYKRKDTIENVTFALCLLFFDGFFFFAFFILLRY